MRPDFNKMELIPVIVQDYQTKEVLMLAYVNEEAYDKMLELKQTVFYSRSRQVSFDRRKNHRDRTLSYFCCRTGCKTFGKWNFNSRSVISKTSGRKSISR